MSVMVTLFPPGQTAMALGVTSVEVSPLAPGGAVKDEGVARGAGQGPARFRDPGRLGRGDRAEQGNLATEGGKGSQGLESAQMRAVERTSFRVCRGLASARARGHQWSRHSQPCGLEEAADSSEHQNPVSRPVPGK